MKNRFLSFLYLIFVGLALVSPNSLLGMRRATQAASKAAKRPLMKKAQDFLIKTAEFGKDIVTDPRIKKSLESKVGKGPRFSTLGGSYRLQAISPMSRIPKNRASSALDFTSSKITPLHANQPEAQEPAISAQDEILRMFSNAPLSPELQKIADQFEQTLNPQEAQTSPSHVEESKEGESDEEEEFAQPSEQGEEQPEPTSSTSLPEFEEANRLEPTMAAEQEMIPVGQIEAPAVRQIYSTIERFPAKDVIYQNTAELAPEAITGMQALQLPQKTNPALQDSSADQSLAIVPAQEGMRSVSRVQRGRQILTREDLTEFRKLLSSIAQEQQQELSIPAVSQALTTQDVPSATEPQFITITVADSQGKIESVTWDMNKLLERIQTEPEIPALEDVQSGMLVPQSRQAAQSSSRLGTLLTQAKEFVFGKNADKQTPIQLDAATLQNLKNVVTGELPQANFALFDDKNKPLVVINVSGSSTTPPSQMAAIKGKQSPLALPAPTEINTPKSPATTHVPKVGESISNPETTEPSLPRSAFQQPTDKLPSPSASTTQPKAHPLLPKDPMPTIQPAIKPAPAVVEKIPALAPSSPTAPTSIPVPSPAPSSSTIPTGAPTPLETSVTPVNPITPLKESLPASLSTAPASAAQPTPSASELMEAFKEARELFKPDSSTSTTPSVTASPVAAESQQSSSSTPSPAGSGLVAEGPIGSAKKTQRVEGEEHLGKPTAKKQEITDIRAIPPAQDQKKLEDTPLAPETQRTTPQEQSHPAQQVSAQPTPEPMQLSAVDPEILPLFDENPLPVQDSSLNQVPEEEKVQDNPPYQQINNLQNTSPQQTASPGAISVPVASGGAITESIASGSGQVGHGGTNTGGAPSSQSLRQGSAVQQSGSILPAKPTQQPLPINKPDQHIQLSSPSAALSQSIVNPAFDPVIPPSRSYYTPSALPETLYEYPHTLPSLGNRPQAEMPISLSQPPRRVPSMLPDKPSSSDQPNISTEDQPLGEPAHIPTDDGSGNTSYTPSPYIPQTTISQTGPGASHAQAIEYVKGKKSSDSERPSIPTKRYFSWFGIIVTLFLIAFRSRKKFDQIIEWIINLF